MTSQEAGYVDDLIARCAGNNAGSGELTSLIEAGDRFGHDRISKAALGVKTESVGRIVYFRGIIEFSNRCRKNCHYCGIRKDNRKIHRFSLDADEIVDGALFAHESGYGSIVLQSGERIDSRFIRFVEDVLRRIKSGPAASIGITLSMGEQKPETYMRWFEAGAERYLLRIETSNPVLYGRIHPADHSYGDRLSCLNSLRKIGYQVGTGVMIGLPGQTFSDLADDIVFFRDLDVDMIGMGPYLPHKDTPMGSNVGELDEAEKAKLLNLSLTMVAACRLVMPDINIAATTAMQALHPSGREMAILAGANVIMPNVTGRRYRPLYQLYDDKPCIDENAKQCRSCLDIRIRAIGETPGYGFRGTPKHFVNRQEADQSSGSGQ